MGVVFLFMEIWFMEEFVFIVDGLKFEKGIDLMIVYGVVKFMGVLWIVFLVCKYL